MNYVGDNHGRSVIKFIIKPIWLYRISSRHDQNDHLVILKELFLILLFKYVKCAFSYSHNTLLDSKYVQTTMKAPIFQTSTEQTKLFQH